MSDNQLSDNGEQLAANGGLPENKQRPNAKYNLSHPDKPVEPGEQENITFHYSRERRLTKAPQAVRDFYTEPKQTRFNLFRPLVADKPRAMLFATIIILCVIILIFSNIGLSDTSYVMDGCKIEITGTRFEGATILILKKTVRTGIAAINSTPYSGAIDIAVSPVTDGDKEFPVFYHRVFFTLDSTEVYRFAVPFDSPDLLLVLQSEKSSLQFKIKPE